MSASLSDCIFAQSSSQGRSAVALHRISGPGAFSKITPSLFIPHKDKEFVLSFSHAQKPVTRYLMLKDAQGTTVDDVLVSFFQAPFSYTGEETVEISCHGNPLIARKIHGLLRSLGMRDALPGEFTQRAFLNGKLDLTQAEAVNELIHAETENGLRLARTTNEGAVSKAALNLRSQLIGTLAYLEAHIDFGTDEVGTYDSLSALPELNKTIQNLENLAASYNTGLKLREGVKVALGGHPNAGKSSLYNALLKADRAIVTDIAGTTRDVLEDRLVIEGRDFVLLDTAGLRETSDVVERIGVSRSRTSLASADVVCAVCDLTSRQNQSVAEFVDSQLQEILSPLGHEVSQVVVLVLSKCDLYDDATEVEASILAQNLPQKVLKCALVHSQDVKALREALVKIYELLTGSGRGQQDAILISARQRDKVTAALNYLLEAKAGLEIADYPEKVASLLNAASQSLAEMIGELSLDSIYESIFSTFCIGK